MTMPPQPPIGKATTRVVATHGVGIPPGTTPLPTIPGTTTAGMIPGIILPGISAGTPPGTTTILGAGAGIVPTTTAVITDGVATMVEATTAITRAITTTAIPALSRAIAAIDAAPAVDMCQTIPAPAALTVHAIVPTAAPRVQDAPPSAALPIAPYLAVLPAQQLLVSILTPRQTALRPAVVLLATLVVPTAAAVHQVVGAPIAAAVPAEVASAVAVAEAVAAVQPVQAVDADRIEN